MNHRRCVIVGLLSAIVVLAWTAPAAAPQSSENLIATIREANDFLHDYAKLPPVVQVTRGKEGERIAKRRLKALKKLIKLDPEQALSLRLSPAERVGLPGFVVRRLEEIVVTTGDFLAIEVDLVEPEVSGARSNLVSVDQRLLEAFVYGRRFGQGSKKGIPINGIAINDRLALSESPLYFLDELELEQRGLKPGTLAAVAGGQLFVFDDPQEIPGVLQQLVARESGPGPYPVELIDMGDPWTNGDKLLLFIRVDFSDRPGPPLWQDGTVLDRDRAFAESTQANDFLVETSHGNTSLLPFTVPIVVRAPNPTSFYAAMPFLGGGSSTLVDHAKQAARDFDDSIGGDGFYNPDSYDRVIIAADGVWRTPDGTLARGGASARGWEWVLMHGVYNWRLMAHELGHTYNLIHSSFGVVHLGSMDPLDTRFVEEYGDLWDVMGGSGFDFSGHYNAYFKQFLGWLPAASVTDVTASGTFRVYAHDQVGASGGLALRVDASPTRERAYWVGVRRNYSTTSNGVEIRYEEDNPFSPGDIGFPVVLLDAVPGTPSRDDHSFEVGQIFNDPAAGITIEVMEIGADATGPYADVRVTLAP